MRLSSDAEIYLSLYYEPEFGDFDGEIIASQFCDAGLRFANVIVRGKLNFFSPSTMRMEVFDFIDGRKVELGAIRASIDPPVLELEGWIFSKGVRFAKDAYTDRDSLSTVCRTPSVD